MCLTALMTTSHAETVCRTKSGVLVSRAKCKKREVSINATLMPEGNLGLGTTAPTAMLEVDGSAIFHDSVSVSSGLTVGGSSIFGGPVTFAAGQTFPNLATLGANTFIGDQMIGGDVILTGQVGIGVVPTHALSLDGAADQSIAVERGTSAAAPGSALTVQAGGAAVGATNMPGGDLLLAAGIGTGTGGGGDIRAQTAAPVASGTGDGVLVDRHIVIANPKNLSLASPGFVSLLSINLTGTNTAGGLINYTIRATDGGSQIATESGTIHYLATANSITCTVDATTKLHLGTVNSGCTPGFFNPGSHPGVSIFDNVSFSSPAPIVVHEVYFSIENESGSPIILQ
jgi:hypothetical protein